MSRLNLPLILRVTLFVFLLTGCTKNKDLCSDVICLNEGICVDGKCHCAEGHEGPNCRAEMVPRQILITKIKVTRFPVWDPFYNISFDSASNPDIYPVIHQMARWGSTTLWTSPVYQKDADPNEYYLFEVNPYVVLGYSNDLTYTISLYDFDEFDDNDFMGSITFGYPYFKGHNFPKKITLDIGGPVAYIITVEYRW